MAQQGNISLDFEKSDRDFLDEYLYSLKNPLNCGSHNVAIKI